MLIDKGNYKLYKGDCLEIMDGLIALGVKFDAIITDPPYGTTACKWDSIIPLDKMWERLNKLIKPKGIVALFGNEPFSSNLRVSNIKNYKYDLVWNKVKKGHPLNCNKMPFIITENISIFINGGMWYNPQFKTKTELEILEVNSKQRKISKDYEDLTHNFKCGGGTTHTKTYPTNIVEVSSISKECNQTTRVHPTQKPVELLEYLIKTYTNEGDLVLDFTMGSGSTGVACLNTNRRFVGVELDEKYFNISVERLENIS